MYSDGFNFKYFSTLKVPCTHEEVSLNKYLIIACHQSPWWNRILCISQSIIRFATACVVEVVDCALTGYYLVQLLLGYSWEWVDFLLFLLLELEPGCSLVFHIQLIYLLKTLPKSRLAWVQKQRLKQKWERYRNSPFFVNRSVVAALPLENSALCFQFW